MNEEANGIKTWQWIVTVIIIIALIVLGYYMFKGNNTATPVTDESISTDSTKTMDSKEINRITITDQFPGNIVYISTVQLAQPGFVVIHKDNAGKPGDIIGSAYFDKGINNGKITLKMPTMEGGVYYAALHLDNGDKVFDSTKDMAIKDSAGQMIIKLFRANSTITEVKG